MVNEKQTKRERNIRSKLMAAIAMLLVSSIMMVSTTYAWFTLSTAPEVKGITTAVGANGNLEMALLPAGETVGTGNTATINYFTDAGTSLGKITSNVGDSMAVADKKLEDANVTWGNLVDLSATSYHMSDIVLYPSQLGTVANGKLDLENGLLETPTYGADGRVNAMKPVTSMGVYAGDGFYPGKGFGVRAIGNVSGMSAREQQFTSALAAANAAASNANKKASIAMNDAGGALASLALKKALNDTPTFNKGEVELLRDAFVNVLVTNGPMDLIKTSIKEYVVAAYLNNVSDENMSAAVTSAIRGVTDLDDLASVLASNSVTTTVTGLTDMITVYTNAYSKAEEARDALDTLLDGATDETTYTWDQLSKWAGYLASTNGMTINGNNMDHWQEKDAQGNYKNIAGLMTAGGININLYSDSDASSFDGVYLAMADFVGTVTGTVTLNNVDVPGFGPISGIPATVNGNGQNPTYLNAAKNAVGTFDKAEGADTNNPISDFYGYIVDMGFRTNAADSYLKLQTTAIDRIYAENTSNVDTMGGGSTMTFSADVGVGYDTTKISNLMSSLRVIFFDPVTGEILGYARLDANEMTTTQSTVGTTTTNSFTMPLKMYDNENNTFRTGDDAAKIVDLSQNQAKAVSVMVYLDGNNITNAEVSTENIRGTMNLQFASSDENLKPMSYSDLQNGTGTQTQG